MILLYVLFLLLIVLGRAVFVSIQAKENGLDSKEWFIKALLYRRVLRELNLTIEHKKAVKESNRVRNEYQNVIEEQKAVEKKIEKSKVSFFNAIYNLSSDLRCIDITIIDQQSHLTASITAKSYSKEIDSIKARLLLKDAEGNQFEVQNMIFRGKCNKDDIWASEDTELLMSQPIKSNDIVDIDIFVEKVIWEDFETNNIDEEQNIFIEKAKDISRLRNVIGADVVTNYLEDATTWKCYCGKSNALSDDICLRCERDRRTFPNLGNMEVLLEKLKECKNLLEAKELIGSFEDLLGSVLAEKVNKQIDKDLYIKKMYGMADEGKAISKYTELIVEG